MKALNNELDNIFKISIPDEQIEQMEEDEYTLKLLIQFSNGKYFLIKPPSYNKFGRFVKDYAVLLRTIQAISHNAELLDISELKDQEQLNDIMANIVAQYQDVIISKAFIKQLLKIIKKYFSFRGRIYQPNDIKVADKQAFTYREFKKYLKHGIITINHIILILSILFNIGEFVKKNVKSAMTKMGMNLESSNQSIHGAKKQEESKVISTLHQSSVSDSSLDGLVKEMTMKESKSTTSEKNIKPDKEIEQNETGLNN